MKKLLAGAVLFGLAAAAFAQSAPAPAPQNQIDLGGGFYDTDPFNANSLGSTANGKLPTSANYGQSSYYSPSLNWNGKYTFALPVDSANTFKFALADDGWYGLYTGTVSSAGGQTKNGGEAGQNAGKVTPSVEYLGFGADVTLSLPIYYFNPADAGGYNTLKYAYKEAGFLPIGPKTTSTNYPLGTNNVVTTTNLSAFYKYSFDKTTWVSGGFSTLLALAPTPWLTSVLPKVSGGAYGVQLDVQFDDYNAYNGGGDAAYYSLYLEPKLTYDLGFLNIVPNLKPYVSSRIALLTTNTAYNSASKVAGTSLHDSFVQPGVAYSYTVPQVGTFSIDAGWRFAAIDNSASGAGTAASPANNDVNPYSDIRIAVGYTYKF